MRPAPQNVSWWLAGRLWGAPGAKSHPKVAATGFILGIVHRLGRPFRTLLGPLSLHTLNRNTLISKQGGGTVRQRSSIAMLSTDGRQGAFSLLGSLPFRFEAARNKQLPTDTRQSAFPLIRLPVRLEAAKSKQLPTDTRQCAFPLLGSLPFRLEAVKNKRLPTDCRQSAVPLLGSSLSVWRPETESLKKS